MSAPVAPEVERELALDMIRRGIPALPLIVLIATLARGADGAASAAFGIGIVLVNLLAAAALLGWAARTSLNLLMAAALGGFVLRMGVVVALIAVVRHESWIDFATLGITVVVTHLGLLVWETRYVSASLAFPGLKPASAKGSPPGSPEANLLGEPGLRGLNGT
jgi:hypothetical protein